MSAASPKSPRKNPRSLQRQGLFFVPIWALAVVLWVAHPLAHIAWHGHDHGHHHGHGHHDDGGQEEQGQQPCSVCLLVSHGGVETPPPPLEQIAAPPSTIVRRVVETPAIQFDREYIRLAVRGPPSHS